MVLNLKKYWAWIFGISRIHTHTHTVHCAEIMKRKTLYFRWKVAYALQSIDHRELKTDRQTNKQPNDGAEKWRCRRKENDNRSSSFFVGLLAGYLACVQIELSMLLRVSTRDIFDHRWKPAEKEANELVVTFIDVCRTNRAVTSVSTRFILFETAWRKKKTRRIRKIPKFMIPFNITWSFNRSRIKRRNSL